MVIRNNYLRMMKQGRFRAVRNIPVGWALQILHSTDRTERAVRIILEILLVFCLWFLLWNFSLFQDNLNRLIFSFIFVHSVSFFFLGNFWVYMLDSFAWVENPGIDTILKYISFVRRVFVKSDSCNAILVYGSMSRKAFHIRSDLDLRIIRKPGLLNGFSAIFLGFIVRVPAALHGNPVDLQVVDSLDFLKKQMRPDEHPIIVYLNPDLHIDNPGLHYDQVLENPAQILKTTPN